MHFAALESSAEHDVGNHEGALVRGALEARTQKMPRCAVRSVAAKQPRRLRELALAVAVPDLAHDTVIALFETNQLFVVLDPQTHPNQVTFEHLLGFMLRDQQHVGISRWQAIEFDARDTFPRGNANVYGPYRLSRGDEGIDVDAHHLEAFEGARLHRDCSRLAKPLGTFDPVLRPHG